MRTLIFGLGLAALLVSGCTETKVIGIKKNVELKDRTLYELDGEEPVTVEEQIEHYLEKLDEHPDNPFIYFRLGQLHEQISQLAMAEQYLKDCLERLPKESDPRPAYFLGRVHLKQQRPDQAIGRFTETLAVPQPKKERYYEIDAYREAYYGLGAAWKMKGNTLKAREALRKFILLGGEPVRAASLMGE